MDSLDIKPNYAALGRKYDMGWRTVKKNHNGYKGKPKTRNKGSKLDQYKDEISDKLTIRRLTVKGVYEFMVKKYGIDSIGSYTNFNFYITKNKLKPKDKNNGGHPRYERGPGEYLNQSEYGHWIIEHYAHISIADRLTFIKGMNMTLPYVADRENFISNIKFSLKDNLCKYLDLDCWIHDFMAPCRAECILTDEGYKVINKKYEKNIEAFIEDMRKEAEEDENSNHEDIPDYIDLSIPEGEYMPFYEEKNEYL